MLMEVKQHFNGVLGRRVAGCGDELYFGLGRISGAGRGEACGCVKGTSLSGGWGHQVSEYHPRGPRDVYHQISIEVG